MLDKFLNHLRYELNRSPLTVRAYETDIQQFQQWLKPDAPDEVDFSLASSGDIRAWLSRLAKDGDNHRTIRRKIISLRSLYKWMMKSGLISSSPVQTIPLPKIPKPLPDIVKPDEIEAAITETTNEDNESPNGKLAQLVIEMLYSLGIRRAELVGINDSDISFSSGEIKITGKRSKQRVVPVPLKLLQKIKEWQEIRDEEYSKPSSNIITHNDIIVHSDNIPVAKGDKNRPLFMVKGKRITPEQVYYIVRKSLQGSSAKKKSPHALRHSFASVMLNGGAEIDTVREFLGHASLATTQIYTHISFKDIKKAYTAAHPRVTKNKGINDDRANSEDS